MGKVGDRTTVGPKELPSYWSHFILVGWYTGCWFGSSSLSCKHHIYVNILLIYMRHPFMLY